MSHFQLISGGVYLLQVSSLEHGKKLPRHNNALTFHVQNTSEQTRGIVASKETWCKNRRGCQLRNRWWDRSTDQAPLLLIFQRYR